MYLIFLILDLCLMLFAIAMFVRARRLIHTLQRVLLEIAAYAPPKDAVPMTPQHIVPTLCPVCGVRPPQCKQLYPVSRWLCDECAWEDARNELISRDEGRSLGLYGNA
jgi:hypothetical protein